MAGRKKVNRPGNRLKPAQSYKKVDGFHPDKTVERYCHVDLLCHCQGQIFCGPFHGRRATEILRHIGFRLNTSPMIVVLASKT